MIAAPRAVLRAVLAAFLLSNFAAGSCATGSCSASGPGGGQAGSKAGLAPARTSGGIGPRVKGLVENFSDVELLEEDVEELLDMPDEELLEDAVDAEPGAAEPAPVEGGAAAAKAQGGRWSELKDKLAGIWRSLRLVLGKDRGWRYAVDKGRPDSPSFYATLCLDVLIIYVVVRIIRSWLAGTDDELARIARIAIVGDDGRARPQERSAPAPVSGVAASSPPGPSLLEAVSKGDAERCRVLLEAASPAGARRMVKETDMWGCTPLHLAAHQKSAALAELLLAFGAELDAMEAWEQTPLHFAARAGSVEVCEVLLAKGASMNAVDSSDYTTLLVAAHADQAAVCELLLDRGASTGGASEDELPAVLNMLLLQRMLVPSSGAAGKACAGEAADHFCEELGDSDEEACAGEAADHFCEELGDSDEEAEEEEASEAEQAKASTQE